MWRIALGDHAAVHRAARDEKVHIFAALTEEIAWRAGQAVLGEQAWMRVLSAVRCLTRRNRKRASSRSPCTSGPGSQTSITGSSRPSSASSRAPILCAIAHERRSSLHLLSVSEPGHPSRRARAGRGQSERRSSTRSRRSLRAGRIDLPAAPAPPLSGGPTAPVAPCSRHARLRAIRDACGSDRFRGRFILGLLEVGCVDGRVCPARRPPFMAFDERL